MNKSFWTYGPTEGFWEEHVDPATNSWQYVFDTKDIRGETYSLLYLLEMFDLIEIGGYYESTDMIRIQD